MSRLDLLWTVKFQNEKHEAETVSTISRLLLENILPKHVAEIILRENMSQVKCMKRQIQKYIYLIYNFYLHVYAKVKLEVYILFARIIDLLV